MKTLLVGAGAAGNKAAFEALQTGIVREEDVILINSTSKDFPPDYKGKTIILSQKDTGCGKERSIAREYAKAAISAGKFNIDSINQYSTVIICTSIEGGTGSGCTPLIAQFFQKVCNKNVHIIAFAGFEDDVRGLANTVEFFKEIDSSIIVQAISNKAFMREAMQNKFKAEEMANREMCQRISVLTGQEFIQSRQNIDDTDIHKVSNTSGYMTVEKKFFDKPLVDQDDFKAVVKKMIYNSKSIKSEDPGAVRIGVILNIDPASEDAVDYTFQDIKDAYGNPYESFLQEQWDGKKEYIAFIVSGMQMPIDELKAIHDRYKAESAKVNHNADAFYQTMQEMEKDDQDNQFDMIKPVKDKGMDIASFLDSVN